MKGTAIVATVLVAFVFCTVQSGYLPCGPEEFQCSSDGKCIHEALVCDEHKDCKENEDEEQNCKHECNTLKFFECDNGECVELGLRCNNNDDCGDNSDEQHCGFKSTEAPAPWRTNPNKQTKKHDNTNYGHAGFKSTEAPAPCKGTEFRCDNGQCLVKESLCNDFEDCSDGSDEKNCPVVCGDHEFLCTNGTHCLHKKYLCNNITDCEDGADELNCESGVHNPCHNEPEGFVCDNYLRCVPPYLVCNGRPDCTDGSDEKNNCSITCSKMKCRNCVPSSSGGVECRCKKGFELSKEDAMKDRKCIDIDECSSPNPSVGQPLCSQQCTNFKGSFRCSCEDGYELNEDKRTCHATGSEPVLVFATMDAIHKYSMYSHILTILIQNLSSVNSLVVDSRGDFVFWSQGGDQPGVYFMSLRYSLQPHSALAFFGLKNPHGLALDYIRENLYVADTDLQAILACKVKVACAVVFNSSVVHQPTEIVLNMEDHLVYWLDEKAYNTPVIMAGSMDGRESREFVSSRLHKPTALTFDPLTQTLFWSDMAQNTVETIGRDGSNRKMLLAHSEAYPSTLAVFEDRLIWANHNGDTIMAVNKFTGHDDTAILTHVGAPKSLSVHHSSLQKAKGGIDPCMGKCQYMCLRGQDFSATCVCPPGKVLSQSHMFCEDSKDLKQWPSALLVCSGQTILEILLTTIGRPNVHSLNVSDMTFVSTLAYLPAANEIWYSSEDRQSFKTSIKRLSSLSRNPQTETVFTDLVSVESLAVDESARLLYWVDDHRKSIEVASLSGSRRTSLPLNDRRRPHILTLDLDNKMLYFSDMGLEPSIVSCHQDGQGCHTLVHEHLLWPNCLLTHGDRLFWSDFQAYSISSVRLDGSKRRIQVVTDHQPMAFTVSDSKLFWIEFEVTFISYLDLAAPSGKVMRLDTKFPLIALVAASRVPAAENSCSDHNGGCDQLCIPTPEGVTCLCGTDFELEDDGISCRQKQHVECDRFQCDDDVTCIDNDEKCNGRWDCPSGFDEENCPVEEIAHQCSKDQFRCLDGSCYSNAWWCDGDRDCDDGRDENPLLCPACTEEQFRCDQTKCIPKSDRCDVHPDCKDGTDEEDCPCPDNYFRCRAEHNCIPPNWVCDGEQECVDGSDEQDCPESECRIDEFLCIEEQKCIDQSRHCDGHDDCSSGEDEHLCPDTSVNECSGSEFPCQPGLNPSKCVPASKVCDGNLDCIDNGGDEDEAFCSKHLFTSLDKCSGFRCGSGLCIERSAICDHKVDCPDGADERNCSVTCATLNCPGICTHFRKGPKCLCPLGHKLVESRYCEDVNECDTLNGGCSQKCRNTKGAHECKCFPGYKLVVDGRTCYASDGHRDLYYLTTRDSVLQVSSKSVSKVASITNSPSRQRLDLNMHTGEIYWLEKEGNKTSLYKTKGKKNKKALVQGLDAVGGLAVDWITGNIFLTQSNSLMVYDSQGQYHAVLHRHSSELDAVMVYPARGLLFWVAKGNQPRLMRSWMNGQQSKTLYSFSGHASTFALSLDPAMERLFVKLRGSRDLVSLDLNGTNSRVQSITGGGVSPITGGAVAGMDSMDVFESIAHMSSRTLKAVVQVRTFDRMGDLTFATDDLPHLPAPPTSLKVMHKLKQLMGDNECSRLQCMYLCVLVPGGAKCLCPSHVKDKRNPTCQGSPTTDQPSVNSTTTAGLCGLDCQNAGQCVLAGNTSFCSCIPEFTGPLCETDRQSLTDQEEESSLAWVAGIVIAILIIAAVVVYGLWYFKHKRCSPNLTETIKYKNADLCTQKDDKEELVPEISFGNPGFQEDMDPDDVKGDQDWWKRLLNRSRASVDSAYVSKRNSGDRSDPEMSSSHKDPNDNYEYHGNYDQARLLK